jgi:hypothetical protein
MAGLDTSASDPSQLVFATDLADLADANARTCVDAGDAVVAVLPTSGRDLAVIGVTRTTASGDRLAAWTRVVDTCIRGNTFRRSGDSPNGRSSPTSPAWRSTTKT